MVCHNCRLKAKKHGKDRKGNQRWLCRPCKRTFAEPCERPLGIMRLPLDKAVMILNLLVEGNSARSVARVTGVHKGTILRLLRQVGEQCERILAARFRDLKVEDVQADELWSFVGMKEKTKRRKGLDDPTLGDAYTYVAFERGSKAILTWHLGHRSARDCGIFVSKLDRATDGRFQLTTDAFAPYYEQVMAQLGWRVHFAQIIKHYEQETQEEQRRYSPARIIGYELVTVHGNPKPDRICTSHVERQNLNFRLYLKRMARLTLGFSKRWDALKAAVALYVAHHNFCKLHSTTRITPAMSLGVERGPWSMLDLIQHAATH